ncbi:MAG: hypothetical protein ACYDG2_21460 [Ruminiclostridium sp.]
MSSNEKKKITKIGLLNSALCNMAELSKKMIKYATPATLCLLALGAALFVANRTSNSYSLVSEITSTTLITNSFFVFAEFIIASLVIDILIRKKAQ